MLATMVVAASSSRGMRMKKMAKMMPTKRTMVSVRHTGRFSLPRHGLLHLASARSHSRSSAAIIRFSTKAMHIPSSSGDSRFNSPLRMPLSHDRLFSPQYSSAANAISSMMRLMFLLFSSKSIPPLCNSTYYITMIPAKMPSEKRRKGKIFCEQGDGRGVSHRRCAFSSASSAVFMSSPPP